VAAVLEGGSRMKDAFFVCLGILLIIVQVILSIGGLLVLGLIVMKVLGIL
jgi:hypothetical protein